MRYARISHATALLSNHNKRCACLSVGCRKPTIQYRKQLVFLLVRIISRNAMCPACCDQVPGSAASSSPFLPYQTHRPLLYFSCLAYYSCILSPQKENLPILEWTICAVYCICVRTIHLFLKSVTSVEVWTTGDYQDDISQPRGYLRQQVQFSCFSSLPLRCFNLTCHMSRRGPPDMWTLPGTWTDLDWRRLWICRVEELFLFDS